MPKKHTYEYVKNFIKSEGYTLLSDTYKNGQVKLSVKCNKGHEYEVKFNKFQQGRRCPICKDTTLTYSYVKDFIELKGYQLLSNTYKNANSKIKVKCDKGHEYEVTFGNFKHKNKRCSICNGGITLTYEHIKEFIESKGYKLLSNNYKNAHTKLKIKCPEDHEYKVNFNNFKQGQRCPFCYNELIFSKQERVIQDFIESLGYDIIRNDRTQIINPLTNRYLELDVWVPDKNKAIEYNGIYWHSFEKRKINDAIKKEQCKQKGIDLLVVNEDKWINNREMEKIIIKNFLCD